MKNKFRKIRIALLCLCIVMMPELNANAAELQAATMMEVLDKVNVRTEPSTDAEIMGLLDTGEKLFATELTDEGWYKVVYLGETGYIKSEFLKIAGSEAWGEEEGTPATAPEGEIVIPEEEVKKASEEALRREAEALEESLSREASLAAEREKAQAAAEAEEQEKAARKKRSMAVTAGVFAGAVLLIAGYSAYTILTELKTSKEAQPQDKAENTEDKFNFIDLEE